MRRALVLFTYLKWQGKVCALFMAAFVRGLQNVIPFAIFWGQTQITACHSDGNSAHFRRRHCALFLTTDERVAWHKSLVFSRFYRRCGHDVTAQEGFSRAIS